MIISIKNGKVYDTEKDLAAPERHILQKLMIWQDLAADLDQFRQKTRDALLKGWNNSGPISPGAALSAIISDWEEKVKIRLKEGG
jgi:hypothetical protein